MEGGFKPWRQQAITNQAPDLDSYGKPLPPPPSGFYWERQDNGEWKLLRMVGLDEHRKIMEFTKPSIVEHTVMPGDTLQGLCLKYRVSAVNVRQLNMFSGSNIQFKKTLLIPIDGVCTIEFQEDTPDVLIQKFRNATHEGPAESRLYLDEHGWDLNAALQAWRNDENWQRDAEASCADIAPGLQILDDIDDNDEEEVINGVPYNVVVPAAIEMVQETIPAYVSIDHPSRLQSMAVDIEMSAIVHDDPSTQPLLA